MRATRLSICQIVGTQSTPIAGVEDETELFCDGAKIWDHVRFNPPAVERDTEFVRPAAKTTDLSPFVQRVAVVFSVVTAVDSN